MRELHLEGVFGVREPGLLGKRGRERGGAEVAANSEGRSRVVPGLGQGMASLS